MVLIAISLKDIYYCPIEIIKGLIDKGQIQNLTKLMGPQEETYLYTTHFHSLRLRSISTAQQKFSTDK